MGERTTHACFLTTLVNSKTEKTTPSEHCSWGRRGTSWGEDGRVEESRGVVVGGWLGKGRA